MTSTPSTPVRRIVRGINRRAQALTAANGKAAADGIEAGVDSPEAVAGVDSPQAVAALERVADLDELEGAWKKALVRDERINEHLIGLVRRAGITSGKVLEIGGRMHPRGHAFDAIAPGAFSYKNLDLEHSDEFTVVGDITGCPEIASDTYDVVISVDVFEHINRPWLAAEEISRILKPGGLSYTSTLFSWRYHPCPIDYWRYTPDALEFLFGDLVTLERDFDTTERRRDVRKKAKLDPMPLDALGGWRENVRVFHAGLKRP